MGFYTVDRPQTLYIQKVEFTGNPATLVSVQGYFTDPNASLSFPPQIFSREKVLELIKNKDSFIAFNSAGKLVKIMLYKDEKGERFVTKGKPYLVVELKGQGSRVS